MRRTLVLAVLAAAFAGTAPAANAYLLNGCQSGDWRVVDLVVAGVEVAEVCMSDNPLRPVFESIRCTPVTCR